MIHLITEDLKIPTPGRPLEAFAMYREHNGRKPGQALLILPGKGYTINHFVLDFIWRMAAETGFYAIKAEYRGYTYRHLGEPYDAEHAVEDVSCVFDYLNKSGFEPENIIPCAKSLGTIALAGFLAENKLQLKKAVLLTPVLYYEKGSGPFPFWSEYPARVQSSYLVFGSDDPYCDMNSAANSLPGSLIDCYEGADHGLHIMGDYVRTIDIQREIIEKVRKFITNSQP